MTSAWQGRFGLLGLVLATLSVATSLAGCDDESAGDADGGVDDGTPSDTGADQTALDTGPDSSFHCPPEGDVVVDADVIEDTTWSCPRYRLVGTVWVRDQATLTIAPGTTIYGDNQGSVSVLFVARGSRLMAVGTAAEPIVFTSGNPVGSRATGDWGGVHLAGDATINAGTNNGGVLEGRLEGADPTAPHVVYGGSTDTGSCGHLEYVRIEFAGAEWAPDPEYNGLTVAGCGSGTILRYIQVHRVQDDGIELFGGTASMDHIVLSGAADDSLDWDLGWRGDVQFLVIHQFPGLGDNGIEADNLGSNELATPRSNPRLFNVTMVGSARGMVLREGTRGLLRNFIVQDFASEAIDLRATTNDLSAEWPTQISIENSFFFNNGAYDDEVTVAADNDDNGFAEQTAIEDAARNNTVGIDPMLGSTSVTTPNYVPTNTALNGQATPPEGFDISATYAGAFAPNGADWTLGWTAFPEN